MTAIVAQDAVPAEPQPINKPVYIQMVFRRNRRPALRRENGYRFAGTGVLRYDKGTDTVSQERRPALPWTFWVQFGINMLSIRVDPEPRVNSNRRHVKSTINKRVWHELLIFDIWLLRDDFADCTMADLWVTDKRGSDKSERIN